MLGLYNYWPVTFTSSYSIYIYVLVICHPILCCVTMQLYVYTCVLVTIKTLMP